MKSSEFNDRLPVPTGDKRLVAVEELALGLDVSSMSLFHSLVADGAPWLARPEVLERHGHARDERQRGEPRKAAAGRGDEEAGGFLEPLLQYADHAWGLPHLRHERLVPEGPHGQDVLPLLQRQPYEALVRRDQANVASRRCKFALLCTSRKQCHILALSQAVADEWLGALECA